MVLRPSRGDAWAVLLVSFFVCTVPGFWMVYRHWAEVHGSVYGCCRAGVLVLLVGLLHLAGYSLYRDQRGWERLRPLLRAVVLQQLIVLFMSGLLLASQIEEYVVAVVAAYWVTVAMILIRRPGLGGRGDLMAVRFGFWGMLFFGFFVVDWLAV
jgi:hypothetical protein